MNGSPTKSNDLFKVFLGVGGGGGGQSKFLWEQLSFWRRLHLSDSWTYLKLFQFSKITISATLILRKQRACLHRIFLLSLVIALAIPRTIIFARDKLQ